VVRGFSRYNRYPLGSDMRNQVRQALKTIVEANNSAERRPVLERLRLEPETLMLPVRVGKDPGDHPKPANALSLRGRRPRAPGICRFSARMGAKGGCTPPFIPAAERRSGRIPALPSSCRKHKRNCRSNSTLAPLVLSTTSTPWRFRFCRVRFKADRSNIDRITARRHREAHDPLFESTPFKPHFILARFNIRDFELSC
jgi:hypothetical protein